MYRPALRQKFLALLFAILPAFIVGSLVFGANMYYDLDAGKIMVNEDNEITGSLTVSGTGDILFSTSGSINQSGTGPVTFTGNVGIGQAVPAAALHLKAGTAAAGTAPLKLTAGINLAAPEAGAIEFDGTNLYFTPSTTRKTIAFDDSIHGAVTLAGENYLSLSAQQITANAINLASTNVTGILPLASGGTGTSTAFTPGSVVFAGASGVYGQDNANFFWDSANKRLGIGTAVPSYSLDIAGNMGITGSTTLAGTNYNKIGPASHEVITVTALASTAIQAAINALPAGGGKVFLPEGTYNVTATITIPSNVWLEGAGNSSTILRLADGVNASVIANSDQTNGNSYIKISNLKIDGNDAGNTGTFNDGIGFRTVTYSEINGVYVYDAEDSGVDLYMFSEYNKIINSIFDNNFYGVAISSDYNTISGDTIINNSEGIYIGYSNYNNISYNVINNNSEWGALLFAAGNNIISNNSINNNGGDNVFDGIQLGGFMAPSNSNIISSNRITDMSGTGYAIDVYSGSNNVIVGNYYSGTGATAINDTGTDTKYTMPNRLAVIANNTDYGAAVTALTVTQSGTGDIVNIFDGATEVFTILDGGRVGIGDASPAALLTVGSGDLFQVVSTGHVRTIAGTAASPSYSFTGDTNTGVYSGGADILKFSTGGSDRMTISANGDINIGGSSIYNGVSRILYQPSSFNIFVGAQAGNTNGFGWDNSGFGAYALSSNANGDENAAVGYYSLVSNTSGSGNAAVGSNSGFYSQTGFSNVFLGNGAGYGLDVYTGANYNTMVGAYAGYSIGNNSSGNIFIGYGAGGNVTTGSRNIIIGYDVDAPLATSANTLNIGNLLFGTGVDGTGTTLSSGNIGIGTASPQEKLTLGSASSFAVEMAVPASPSATPTTGGTLTADTYYYKVTALDGAGETTGSSEVSCVVDGAATTACQIGWTATTGAASYRIYGRATGAQDQYWTATTNTYTDTGTAGTAGTVPTTTTSYVNKLAASGNSWILGGNVGIGTAAPSAALTLGADKSLRITGGTSFPGSPSEGEMFFRTDTYQLYAYANAKWQADRTTATKIVAANDSQNKEKADYVADGTNDEADIENAVAALPSTGGVIYLLDGTYNIGASIDITKSNVSLIGAGKSTILKLAASANTSVLVVGDGGTTAVEGIIISQIQVDGNKANNATGLYGIYFNNKVTKSRIEKVWTHDNVSNGIILSASASGNANSYNTITQNDVTSNGGSGVNLSEYSNNNLISNNNISDSNTYLSSWPSGMLIASSYNTISGNNIKDNYNYGIGLYGSYNLLTGNNVQSNNTANDTTTFELYLTGSYNVISGNTFISETVSETIRIDGSHNTISGNLITQSGSSYDGIKIRGVGGVSNVISSNRIIRTANSGGYGINIYTSGSSDHYIIGNEITGSWSAKIKDDSLRTTIQQRDWFEIESARTSGTLLSLGIPSATTLAGALVGANINLSSNLTATGQSVTGQSISLPAVTNTGAGTYNYKGLTVAGGALIQNTGAGIDNWTGLDITMPNITQTTGTITSTGLKITGGTVTSGTSYGLIVDTNAGNVGIGTTSPQQKLTLGSASNFAVEMAVPASPSVTPTTGGTLTAGTYYYKVTALDGAGETAGSSEVSCVVDGVTTTACQIAWTASTGAASYRIYGRATGAQDQYWTATTNTYTDTGTAGTAGTVPTTTTSYVNKLAASGNSWILGGSVGIGTATPNNTIQVADLINFYNTDLNTSIGYQAGKNIVSGAQYNTFLGYQAGYSSSTASTNDADNNTVIGYQSLYSNTTGTQNVVIGNQALRSNATGYSNSAMGVNALRSNTEGGENLAMGNQALFSNTTGSYNSAMGYRALYYTQTGNYNTTIGYEAGKGAINNSFSNNTLLGYRAGYGLTTGSNNILVGYKAGDDFTTGTKNIIIGYDIDVPAAGNNQLNIGNLLFGTGIDGAGTTLSTGSIGIGKTSPAYKLDVSGTIGISTPATPVVTGSVTSTSLDGAKAVYVSGKYAYVGNSAGDRLTVVDISRPTNPIVIGSIQDSNYLDEIKGVYVSGKYVYVLSSWYLTVVDVSNPASPSIAGTMGGIDTWAYSQGAIYVSGKYAYIADSGNNKVVVVDISNPASPSIAGSVTDATYLSMVGSLYVSGRYAYVLTGNQYLTVIDISNPASPSIAGQVTSTNFPTSNKGQWSIYISGRYAYIASNDNDRLTVVDISNPGAPSVTGSVTSTNLDGAKSVMVAGKYAYVMAKAGHRLTIVDISNPASPSVTASLQDATNLYYGEQCFVSGRYAYCTSYTNDRLTIVEVSGFESSTANIGSIQTNNLTAWENIDVGNSLYVRNGLNVGSGGIYSGGPLSILSSGTSSSLGALDVRNSAGTSLLYVRDDGNIGIGTAAPAEKLTVRQDLAGNLLGLYDGANNTTLAVADGGQTAFKPSAFDTVYTFDGAAAYADNTAEAKTSAGTAFIILADEPSSNDEFYLGLDHPFNTVYFDIAVAGSPITLSAQYWNGAWTGLTLTADNTANLTTDGTVTFTAPSGWVTTAVNGVTKYWIRLRSPFDNFSAPTAYSVSPTTGNRFYVYGQSGDTAPALYVNDKGNVGIGTDLSYFDSAPLSVVNAKDSTGNNLLGIFSSPPMSVATSSYLQVKQYNGGVTHTSAYIIADMMAGTIRINNTDPTLTANHFVIDGMGSVGIGTVPLTDAKLEVAGNILFSKEAARTLSIGRTTTAATAGYNLTISASGAVSGGADLAGGNTYLTSGISTGSGSSNIYFQTSGGGATGTADKALATAMTILGNGNVGIGTITPNNTIQVADLINFYNTDFNSSIGYQAGKNVASGAQYNTFLGYQAGLSSAAGSTNAADYNTAIGYQALYSNTSGASNIALGNSALYSNTIGSNNLAIGSAALLNNATGDYNLAMGLMALSDNTIGYSNVAIGVEALRYNTEGDLNTAIGYGSGKANAGGNSNVFLGSSAGASNDYGNYNTFLGVSAGYANIASNNTFIGYQAGDSNTSGASNIIIGYQSGQAQTTATRNTFLGYQAGYVNTASDNLFIGYQSGDSVTSGAYNTLIGVSSGQAIVTGANNTFLGYQAGTLNTASSNTFIGVSAGQANVTGTYGTFLGYQAGYLNTASNNVFIGSFAGDSNTSGTQNVFLGVQSGDKNTVGNYNTFLGAVSGFWNTTGNNNTVFGHSSLYNNETGSANTIFGKEAGYGVSNNSFASSTLLGYRAGYGLSTGSNNILLGYQAGDNLTTGASNIIIGYDIDAPLATSANTLNIGNLIFGTGIDGTGTTLSSGNIGIGTTSPGSKLTVAGTITLDNTTVVSGALADAPATGTCTGQANSASQAVFQTSTSVTSSHIFYNSTRSKHARITSAATCVDGSANTWQILTLTDSITGNAATDSYTVYNPAGDIGTTTAGFINNLYAINGKFVTATVSGGFDIAEEYQTNDESIEAGDTVSIDPNNPLFIAKSSASYDKKLLGVISTNPGLSLGNETIGAWRKVALSGRVATKVSLENGPIQIGDYLTSSSESGVAMKATEPGRVIGMALESYGFEKSEILNPKSETNSNIPNSSSPNKDSLGFSASNLEFPDNEVGRVMVFVNPHWSIGPLTDDGLIANSENNNEGQNEPKTTLDKFTLAIKESLDKLGLALKDGVAQVKEFIAGKITTKKLCIEGEDGEVVCVEKDQLKELLNKSNNQEAPSIPPAPVEEDVIEPPAITPAPEPTPEPVPEPTPVIEPAPIPEPEIVPAPEEPAPESTPISEPAPQPETGLPLAEIPESIPIMAPAQEEE